jgi:hypothetical protein
LGDGRDIDGILGKRETARILRGGGAAGLKHIRAWPHKPERFERRPGGAGLRPASAMPDVALTFERRHT